MCAAIANYTSQYGNWNRTRRLQVPPYVATENNVTRTQTRLAAADALIINMNEVDGLINPTNRPTPPTEPSKKDVTLFGPGVGIIPSGPGWTGSSSSSKDEISADVIKSWMAKSKDTTIPTTTLQALVNLKRPSIKLSPLAAPSGTTEAAAQAQHGLQFEFDCDAPKCGIRIFALDQKEITNKLLLFESLLDGGFARILKYDEGAVLELGQLEFGHDENGMPSQSQSQTTPLAEVVDPSNQSTPNGTSNNLEDPVPQAGTRTRKRFSQFTFRKRGGAARQVAGPALPVVDADTTTSNPSEPEAHDSSPPADLSQTKEVKEEVKGIKVLIEIEALDQEGMSLSSPNSQLTYLHIVRMGAAPSEEEDKRPWMVKVVKREAKIGTHLFHLHEIYGLSSATSTSQLPTAEHTYPPTEQADDQTSECLLCLSSPREVVLLPCRHLVACRECAVNMVEFGAGGSLVHTEPEVPTGQTPATASTAPVGEQDPNATGVTSANAANGATASATPSIPHPPRRKRKAKGWFCPVCRQPYTSLLRITATPPEKEGLVSGSSEESNNEPSEAAAPVIPEPAVTGLDVRSFFPRPNFLRSLSRPGSRPSTANTSNMV